MPVLAAPECVKWAEAQQSLGIPDEKVLASPVCLAGHARGARRLPRVVLRDPRPRWVPTPAIPRSCRTGSTSPRSARSSTSRPVGAGRFRPGDDARQVAQRDRPRRHQHRCDPRGDGRVRGPLILEVAGGRLRQYPRRPPCAATRSSTATPAVPSDRSATSCRRPTDGSPRSRRSR